MENFDVGGVQATRDQIIAALTKLEATGGTAIAQQLRSIGSPLSSCDYHKVARDTRAAFPALIHKSGTKQSPTAHEKNAFTFALRVYAVLAQDLPAPEVASGEGDQADPGSGPDYDPIAARNAAKKKYGEDQAKKWAEGEFPAALLVKKVGDDNPKPGYDVRVITADGSEIHIEAKCSGSNGDVELTKGEVDHVQGTGAKNPCAHEHILFRVLNAHFTETSGEWKCLGSDADIHRGWAIDVSSLTPSRYAYKTPVATVTVHLGAS